MTTTQLPASLTTTDYDAARLRALRCARGLTQEEVARQIGVSRMMVYLAENRSASWRMLNRMADLYGVSTKELLLDG